MNLQNKLFVITLLTLSGNVFAAEAEDASSLVEVPSFDAVSDCCSDFSGSVHSAGVCNIRWFSSDESSECESIEKVAGDESQQEESDTKKDLKILPLTKESFKQLNITAPEEDDSSDDCFSVVPSLQHASDCSTCSELPHTQIEESSTNKS